jgi:hypothetical protein
VPPPNSLASPTGADARGASAIAGDAANEAAATPAKIFWLNVIVIPSASATRRKFYRAEQEAGFAEAAPTDTPQTRHPAYRLAFRDVDFMLRDELRPVRFQLELLKPEMLLDEAGSARRW